MSLLEDFAKFVLDMQNAAAYLAWARDNHGGAGYSIDNPKTGSELQKWMVFRDQILRGTRPSPPAMTTALGKGLVDGGVEYLDATAPVTPPPPPPPQTRKLWGISPSSDWHPSIDVQMAEYVALGINCPRIEGTDAAALSARSHGFKQWIAWLTGDGSATPDQVVAYARKYPEAMVGFGNELNGNPDWPVAEIAAKQIAVYQAVKASGLPNKVMLTSLETPASRPEGFSILDFCKHLRDAGCTLGKAFDIADFHFYAAEPQHIDDWAHIWTPNTAGETCTGVLGGAPFVMTEFGAEIGKDVGTDTAQAAAVTAWVNRLRQVPSCLGGMWFEAFDGTSWSGFGLIDGAGNHRPAYQAFKTAIAS